MVANLTHEEESYLRRYLAHRLRERKRVRIAANILLLFGGVLMISAIVYLLLHVTDQNVYLIALPSLLAGILLVIVYAGVVGRERESEKLLRILSSLLEAR